MLVVVQSVDIWVVPYLTSTQSGVPVTLQSDAVYWFLGQSDALRSTSLNSDFCEIAFQEEIYFPFSLCYGSIECYLDYLCFSVGIGREVHYL